jgi:DNA-binding NarL/FixJ family response regulator
MSKIKVFIADDHPVLVQGIEKHLNADGRFWVIGTSSNGNALLNDKALRLSDVLLLDLNMPHINGLECISALKGESLSPKIIVHTSYDSIQLIKDCQKRGADGYMIKTSELDVLTNTIMQVASGKKVFPEAAQVNISSETFYLYDNFLKKFKLTKREVEIIRLICKKLKTKEIASVLNISEFTVSTHRKNINFKLGIKDSLIELFDFAQKNGLLEDRP